MEVASLPQGIGSLKNEADLARFIAQQLQQHGSVNANQVLGLSAAVAPIVTALPAGAQNGQLVIYATDAANGVNWLLRYNASSASAYKWEFLGGAPLWAEVATDQGTNSGTYVALATAGPSIALPLAGDYMVKIGAGSYQTGGNGDSFMSYDIGGTGAVDADAYQAGNLVGQGPPAGARARRKTGLAAVTLTAKYRAGAWTAQFRQRWMQVTPVRVG